ncbi:MAG TPA: hypothetical protein VJJ55_02020 [Candidatus Paceibacterota bacterium]
MNYSTYTLWPWLKVKTRYWWWVIRYGGKKNIPPELIFGQMEKSMARMKENLMQALRNFPKELGEEDKQMLLDAIGKAEEMDKAQQEMRRGVSRK